MSFDTFLKNEYSEKIVGLTVFDIDIKGGKKGMHLFGVYSIGAI